MSIEGIFRKNGNIRRLRDLTDAIDRDPASVDLSQDNPVQLAALLKKFLRDLPDPLMTFKLHRLFIASQCGSRLSFVLKSLILMVHSSSSTRRRSKTISPSDFTYHAQKSSGHYGGFIRFSQMGCLLCPFGCRNGQQNGSWKPGDCDLS